MWKNSNLADIKEQLFSGRLGKALSMTESYLLAYPQQYDRGALLDLKNNLQFMTDYWRRGSADPKREELYQVLLRRLYSFVADVELQDRINHTSFLHSSFLRSATLRQELSESYIRQHLEEYVSSLAMLDLEPAQQKDAKKDQLCREHQLFVSTLFDYILTSFQWSDWQADMFQNVLLSLTVDTLDQQLILSAVMLSCMNTFDYNKFCTMVNVYRTTTDDALRQRALVGWVSCADSSMSSLYPELRSMIAEMCEDEQVCKELTELQMQIVFCQNAEEDRQTIQNEIMPNLMEAGNLRITREGIEEVEEDPMQDILHPDAAEQNMERMEQSMHRMMDMQKQGSDIYFAGFSQMKRFPFFSDVSNWFVPFYSDHPGISQTWNQSKGRRFLHLIMKMGAFCDSDKYSFVLAFEQVLSRLPQQMLQMVEQGEASPMPVGGQVSIDEQRQPAFVRRLYLQNLYRFFRLNVQRSEFVDPFEQNRSLFFVNQLFHATALERHMVEIASFLMKRHLKDQARSVLANVGDAHRDARFHVLWGSLLMQSADPQSVLQAKDSYAKALTFEPDNRIALKGYARACFACSDYADALSVYRQLLAQDEENKSVMLNTSVCLTHLKEYEESLKLLFKLNYMYADDENVVRVLAWTLTVAGRFSQAVKYFDQLLSSEHVQAADFLNCGYCHWFSGDVTGAVSMFRQFLSAPDNDQFSMENEFLQTEHELILEHGISQTEILLMLDVLEC